LAICFHDVLAGIIIFVIVKQLNPKVMGKIKQGILGGVSGSVGGVVGSSWKGINVIKSKPQSVANPKTAGQVAQRGAFSEVVAFATVILAAIIKPLWDRFQVAKSGYNAFVSANIAFFDATGLITPASLLISKGKMEATAITNLSVLAASKNVDFEWVNDSGTGYKLATDGEYAVAYNETTGEIVFNGGGQVRSDISSDLSFATNMVSGDVIHVWQAFRRADGTVVSNTSYATAVVA